ncbi:MAG: hypothetical protein EBS66_07785 [Betaproteobacteria bacterium]|nr:hypothetical protein [Betaproteobacteria bacterium]
MAINRQVGVIGQAVYAPRNAAQASLEEGLYAVTHAALKNAGLTIEDIDGIVVAGHDQMDGRAITIMMASGSVGGVTRDILATPSGAEHAFVLGALRVRSGMYKTQLVVSWSPLETENINDVQRLANDPYYHRQLPLDDLASHALQANVLEHSIPKLRDAVIELTRQMRQNGVKAYPHYSPAPTEKVWVALVLAGDEWLNEHKDHSTAFVHGMGWATETAYLGDRDLSQLTSLKAATQQAYVEAGITKPQFDLAEVADATAYQALMSLEGLGLCDRKNWVDAVFKGDFDHQGSMPVNLSGGASSFNPIFCSGLMRIAEAANQVRGCAGAHQKSNVKKSVAHGASGFAMQYNTVVVFGKQPREALK